MTKRWRIHFTKRVVRQLSKLTKKCQKRILVYFESVQKFQRPDIHGTQLKTPKRTYWRFPFGIYNFIASRKHYIMTIVIIRILPRKEGYK